MKTKQLAIKVTMFVFAIFIYSCSKTDYNLFDNPEKLRLTKTLTYSINASDQVVEEVIFTYNKSGELIEESFYNISIPENKPYMRKEYKYENNKKIIERIFYRHKDSLKLGSNILFFYSKNLLEKEEHYDQNDDLTHTTSYEYDNNKNLTRKHSQHKDYSDEIKYSYDNKNLLILEERTNFSRTYSSKHYIKYTYDNIGREIKEENYFNNWELYSYKKTMHKDLYNSTSVYYDKGSNETYKEHKTYDQWRNLTAIFQDDGKYIFKKKYIGKLIMEETYYYNDICYDKLSWQRGVIKKYIYEQNE